MACITAILLTVILLNLTVAAENVLPLEEFERGPTSNLTCGEDNLEGSGVFEGSANIKTFPWIGYLIYPIDDKLYSSVVVLVTKQMCLGTANEIDKLPKVDFRAQSYVVLGTGCTKSPIRVRDYVFHPDYASTTYSALAMIQLETDDRALKIENSGVGGLTRTVEVKSSETKLLTASRLDANEEARGNEHFCLPGPYICDSAKPPDLQPICPPPTHFIEPRIFAISLAENCKRPVVKLYEMVYVNPDECRTFYRRSGLDVSSMWPTHTACARAINGGECVWRSGAALAVKQGGKWRLLGFGVYGPGCGAPARFLDYGKIQMWVRRSIRNIGMPAITRMSPNEVVLRRSLSHLQRFGPCDSEETRFEIYTDRTHITYETEPGIGIKVVRYNLTVYAGVEYSCVVFRATPKPPYISRPMIFLRRWCAGVESLCLSFQFVEIEFYVEIYFSGSLKYEVKAYGQEPRAMDHYTAMQYANKFKKKPLIVRNISWPVQLLANISKEEDWLRWFWRRNIKTGDLEEVATKKPTTN